LRPLLAQDAEDVLGVVVGLGEDEGLGELGAAGEDVGEQAGPEGRMTVRIWIGHDTLRSSWEAV
jgi:hypothetical protein